MKNHESSKTKSNIKKFAAASAIALASSSVAGMSAGASTHQSESRQAKVLTNIIRGLERGGSANTTAQNVELPGNEIGQPLIYKVGNKTFLAYRKDAMPNFDQKRVAGIVGEMTVIKAPKQDTGIATAKAHLNKEDELVGENEQIVGESTPNNSVSGSEIVAEEQLISSDIAQQIPVTFLNSILEVQDQKGNFFVANPLSATTPEGIQLYGYIEPKGGPSGPVVNLFQSSGNMNLLSNPSNPKNMPVVNEVIFPSSSANGSTFDPNNPVNPVTSTQYVTIGNASAQIGFQYFTN